MPKKAEKGFEEIVPEETKLEETMPEEAEPEEKQAETLRETEDILSLGGNIELNGFRDIDKSSMVIVKKIVGNYAKTFSERCKGFERLIVHLKIVHETEKSKKYEIHAYLFDSGKRHVAEEIDRNMFFALDSVLKKLEGMIE